MVSYLGVRDKIGYRRYSYSARVVSYEAFEHMVNRHGVLRRGVGNERGKE